MAESAMRARRINGSASNERAKSAPIASQASLKDNTSAALCTRGSARVLVSGSTGPIGRLRNRETGKIRLRGLETVQKKSHAEKAEAHARQQPGIDARFEHGRHRRGQELSRAGHHHDLADLKRRMAANEAEEDGQEVDRAIKADA